MRVLISTEFRVYSYKDNYYLANQHYFILKRYYDSFGSIILCTRFVNVDSKPKDLYNATEIINQTIKLNKISDIFSKKITNEIKTSVKNCDLVICRLGSISASYVAKIARKMDKKVFSEVMNDIWDAYYNHSFIGKIFAPFAYFITRNTIKKSDFVLYVTSRYLQNKYPNSNKTVGVSNVMINDGDEHVLERRFDTNEKHNQTGSICIMTTAAVDVKYKGQRYVIEALSKLKKRGIDVKYYLAGDGNQDYLKRFAEKNHVSENVFFFGRLSLDEIFQKLENMDIYIQPSLQEGLPRSLIEGMSMGCYCIGAKTAGIPELIPYECVFKRKNANAIVNKILDFCNLSLEEKNDYSKKNFYESRKYINSVLDSKRKDYYEYVIQTVMK